MYRTVAVCGEGAGAGINNAALGQAAFTVPPNTDLDVDFERVARQDVLLEHNAVRIDRMDRSRRQQLQPPIRPLHAMARHPSSSIVGTP
jgi:hypothetical protein